MFANLLHLISRRMQPGYDRRFVRGVAVRKRPVRNRRMERLIWICWGLIAVKSAFVAWAVPHYRIPFSPLWVILPTIAFAALCTAVYHWRDR
jgi:peptidoglycan/LPS O-acetylase OafA/YrhL